MNLIESERTKYEAAWRVAARQVCHGLMLWDDYRALFPHRPKTALDIGCGAGRLIETWNECGIAARGYDIAETAPNQRVREFVQIGCLWQDPIVGHFDMGCCADVMEHLPPEKVDDALLNIHSACDVVVYKIANFESTWCGQDLHLTLRPRDWWQAALERRGDVQFMTGRPGVEEYIFRVQTYARV